MRKLHLASVLAFAVALTSPADAQLPCYNGDDGFDLGCCDEPHPNLPKFPKVEVKGLYACLRDCGVEQKVDVKVTVGQPEFYSCDSAIIEMEMNAGFPGGPNLKGKLIVKYSRTWITSLDGTQVWRFLLNGDWSYGPAIGVFGCPTPPHAGPSHVVGSIDYACEPNNPDSARIALNLSHLPGCISHSSMSARPHAGAAAHTNRSYHLVAPNSFGFGVVSDIQGALFQEAVRSSPTGNCFPHTYKCLNESDVIEGGLETSFVNCVCPSITPATSAWAHQKMKGEVVCNGSTSTFATASNVDPFVPTGLAGLRLGRYSGPNFPGDMELTVYFGYIEYSDVCGPAVDAKPHRVSGVGTLGTPGYLFSPTPSFQPFKAFVDLEDNLLPGTSNPIPVPGPLPALCVPLSLGFGAPAYSSLVWNLNPVN